MRYPQRRFMGAATVSAALTSTTDPNREYQRYTEGRRVKFIYQTPNISSIANAGSTTNTIQFDVDSQFVWVKTTVTADIAGAVQTEDSLVVPLVTLLITDLGSGQNFMNAALPVQSLAGLSGELPYIEPSPQMIAPNSSLQFQWANYSNATTYANLRVQLHGYKVYGTSPPPQL